MMLMVTLSACTGDDTIPSNANVALPSTPNEPALTNAPSGENTIQQTVTEEQTQIIIPGDGVTTCVVCGIEGDICTACGWCIDCDPYIRCADCNYGVDCCECEDALEIYQFEPITITGSGSQITDVIDVPVALSVFSFSHTGQRNFTVRQNAADLEEVRGGLLANETGDSTGASILHVEDGQVVFAVNADGDWNLTISPFQIVETAELSGSGNVVSGIFPAPSRDVYRFTHDGRRNFTVRIHPLTGRDRLIANEVGIADVTAIVDFGDDYAFWEIRGDGNWTITLD